MQKNKLNDEICSHAGSADRFTITVFPSYWFPFTVDVTYTFLDAAVEEYDFAVPDSELEVTGR